MALLFVSTAAAAMAPGGADAALQPPLFAPCELSKFPADFALGVGTAAYQVEGCSDCDGREPSIWDTFAHEAGRVAHSDTGDLACDHFHKYEDDIALVEQLGMKHYRFSISWSRAMSWDETAQAMAPNEAGLAFYARLIDALLQHGIEPWVTLYHWDLPQSLHDNKGGWHSPRNGPMLDEFEAYAALCFARFGDRVKRWFTFNEPYTFITAGYCGGFHAPGCAPRVSDEERKAGKGCPDSAVPTHAAAHNVLLAHARAVKRYRSEFAPAQRGAIGITLNVPFALPANGSSPEDVKAAARNNAFQLGGLASAPRTHARVSPSAATISASHPRTAPTAAPRARHAGWFLEPLQRGKFPKPMRRALPPGVLLRFSRDERALLLDHPVDFLGLHQSRTPCTATSAFSAPCTTENAGYCVCAAAGLNYYGPHLVAPSSSPPSGVGCTFDDVQAISISRDPSWPLAEGVPWLASYPESIRLMLRLVTKTYRFKGALYITENGWAAKSDSAASAPADVQHEQYFAQHLAQLRRAVVEDGVDLRGYFAWTLMDNFEWADGYATRFGLYYVDRSDPTLRRVPRRAALWWANQTRGQCAAVEDDAY